MPDSSIEDLWKTVYANGSIPNMLTGHFYSLALAAHLTTYAALMIILMNQNPELSDCLKDLCDVKSVFS